MSAPSGIVSRTMPSTVTPSAPTSRPLVLQSVQVTPSSMEYEYSSVEARTPAEAPSSAVTPASTWELECQSSGPGTTLVKVGTSASTPSWNDRSSMRVARPGRLVRVRVRFSSASVAVSTARTRLTASPETWAAEEELPSLSWRVTWKAPEGGYTSWVPSYTTTGPETVTSSPPLTQSPSSRSPWMAPDAAREPISSRSFSTRNSSRAMKGVVMSSMIVPTLASHSSSWGQLQLNSTRKWTQMVLLSESWTMSVRSEARVTRPSGSVTSFMYEPPICRPASSTTPAPSGSRVSCTRVGRVERPVGLTFTLKL